MKTQRSEMMALLAAGALLLGLTPSASSQGFPNPQPTEAHKVLALEVGTWDSVVKMFLGGPDAPPVEYKGSETTELICGGLYSKSTFKGKFGDRDFEGHGFTAYDAKAKTYVGTWVDSFSTTPTTMTGTYDAEKKIFTVSFKETTENGEEMEMKQVTTYLDATNKKMEHFLKVGEAEMKLMEIVSKKRE